MKIFPLLALAAAAAGCASDRKQLITFESDPPGARIFYGMGANEGFAGNKEYIGTTPCDWTATVDGAGHFKPSGVFVYSIFVPPAVVFVAEPPAGSTNLFPQRLVFHGGALIFTAADKAPGKLFFDLHKETVRK